MFKTSTSREKSNSEKYTARLHKFGTENVLPLWVADMDIDTPDFIINAMKKRLEHPILGYEEMPHSAFDTQITWMKKHHNLELQRKEMFFSPSVLTSLNLAIQTFSKIGDEIIIQTPIYPAFASSIKNNARVVLENPLQNNSFDLEDLETKISPKTKLLILCSPHNPIGRVWEKEELLTLAKICLKHNIIVIADEIHCDLSFKKHTPFASLSHEIAQQTISLLSPAKTFNISGLSISTISIQNSTLREQFERTYKASYLGEGNILAHVAFETAYTQGSVWLDKLKLHLHNNFDKIDRLLKSEKSKITFSKPDASFLLWLDCRALGLSDEELNQHFINAKLGLNQGVNFGTGGNGFMRLNVGISEDILEEVMEKLSLI